MTVEQTELVDMAEIARRAGVARDTVARWRIRYGDFPAPARRFGRSPVWRWPEVRRWLEATGRT